MSFLTARPADPAGYGRVVRCGEGRVKAIVEHDDAPPEVREIREVNAGVYCFENRFLDRALGRLRAANRQEEYYLTDVIAAAVRAGLTGRAACPATTRRRCSGSTTACSSRTPRRCCAGACSSG